jgi:hypothetical protein
VLGMGAQAAPALIFIEDVAFACSQPLGQGLHGQGQDRDIFRPDPVLQQGHGNTAEMGRRKTGSLTG